MKKLLLLITLLASVSAHAFDYEVSAGKTFYTQSNNTIWWQDGFSNNFQLSPNMFSLGLRGDSWRVGYANLGKATMSALVVEADADYNTTTKACNPGCHMVNIKGDSQTRGLYATRLFKANNGLFAEAGVWAYQTTMSMSVVSTTRQNYSYTLPMRPTYGLGPVLGVGYERGNYTLAATAYYVRRYGEYPAIYKPFAAVLSVRYKF